MADQNPNLRELMEALEAERLKGGLLRSRIETYRQIIKNLSGVIVALTDNVDVTNADNPEIIAEALTVWMGTLQGLKEMDEHDKITGWDELTA